MVPSLLNNAVRYRARRDGSEPLDRTAVHSVALAEMTRLGDVLTTIPALRLFRKTFPSARITLFVQSPYDRLLRALSLDIEVSGLAMSETVLGLLKGLRLVRACKPDLACSLSPAKRNAVLVLGSGATSRAGYLQSLNNPIQYLEESPINGLGVGIDRGLAYGKMHLSERSLLVCRSLGITADPDFGKITLRDSVRKEMEGRLKRSLPLLPRSYAVVHPFAGWEFKQWLASAFEDLATRFLAAGDDDIVFLAAAEERSRWGPLRKTFRNHPRAHFMESSDLCESAYLIEGARVFVGNDSGPLHLASLLGTPVVGLYGPSSPDLTAPRGAKGEFLHSPVECSPCAQARCVRPGEHCMLAISPSDVLDAMTRQKLPSALIQTVACA
jgi:heptosyltransferase-3